MAVTGEKLIYEIVVNSSGASEEFKKLDKSVNQLNKSTQNISKTFDVFKGVLAGYLSFQGAKAFLELADSMQEAQVRLSVLTGSMEAALEVQEELFLVAQKHSVALKELNKSYTQIAPVLAEQGKSQREIIQFTDNLIASYKLIGQSSSEAAQSVGQLAQAYASGKIDANQLGQVLKTNRELLKAVAKEMGVTEAQLLKMAKAGKISGEQFFQAVIRAGEEWQKRAKELPTGIDEALTNLSNSLTKLAGDFAPVVELISKFILVISENFPAAAGAITAVAAAIGLAKLATIEWNLALLANPIGITAAAIGAAVYLIIDNWKQVQIFFYELFYVSIPNAIAEGEKVMLGWGKSFVEDILNPMILAFEDFINKLIDGYNKIAEKLNWEKIERVEFRLDTYDTTKQIEEINKQIGVRNKQLETYIKSLETIAKKTNNLDKRGKGVPELPEEVKLGDIKGKAKEVSPFEEGDVGYALEQRKRDLQDIQYIFERMSDTDPLGGFVAGIAKVSAEIPTVTEAAAKVGEMAFKGLTKSLTDFVRTGKLEFKDLFDTISAYLIELAIQKAVLKGIESIFGPTPTPKPAAKGAVFEGGHWTKFAKGGVVTKPTVFPFANGIGLMAENSAEAIMPLHRDSKGSLGVKAAGSGGNTTVVNIFNQAKDTETETKESTDRNGMKKIDVFIKTAVKGIFQSGEMDKTMQTSFGLARTGSR